MRTRTKYFKLFLVFFIILGLNACASTFHPYHSSFQCPATYGGLCESMQDAYNDSVSGINPARFDKKYERKQKKWKKEHKALIQARKKAKNLFNDYSSKKNSFYRKELFRTLSSLLVEPEKPMLVPPKIVRILVLSSLAKDNRNQSTIYISPHYVFFMLDKPHWLLHKIPELVPFDPENPMIKK